MGRAPCCDKANVKKGPWSPEEDAKLKTYIDQHGTGGNWIALPQKIGLKRCGKSCRLRWLNYLRPNIKHGGFSEEEDNLICSLYMSIGSRWSIIAAQLPGRTDNDIKNYWNTRLKKKLLGKQRKEHTQRRENRSKQGAKKSIVENSIVSNTNINQMLPSCPGAIPVLAPILYSNYEPRFNDHASIRQLLIKLGGKFSNDGDNITNGHNIQIPSSSYEIPNSINATSLCSSIDELNSCPSQISDLPILPVGNINISAEIEGIIGKGGLEFLYDSIDWAEIRNLRYTPIISNSEGALLQECGFDDLRYPRFC